MHGANICFSLSFNRLYDSTPFNLGKTLGKYIPHFKKWNSMMPQWNAWDANSLGVGFLFPVYSGIGKAREFSPALRSTHRWFLNRQAAPGSPNEQIFAVAKYTSPNAPLRSRMSCLPL